MYTTIIIVFVVTIIIVIVKSYLLMYTIIHYYFLNQGYKYIYTYPILTVYTYSICICVCRYITDAHIHALTHVKRAFFRGECRTERVILTQEKGLCKNGKGVRVGAYVERSERGEGGGR